MYRNECLEWLCGRGGGEVILMVLLRSSRIPGPRAYKLAWTYIDHRPLTGQLHVYCW